jgi:NAD(P)-dependent dehydrogenase (short-subunit alcohol dehydrogenase family)
VSRTVAVTGASRGIGRATVIAFARAGDRVFALARTESDLETLVAECREQGWAVEPVVMDVADAESRQAAVNRIMSQTGGYGVDVLVNNAGYGQTGPLEEVSAEQLERQLDVNVIGVLALTQPFLPAMRERRRGWIVNVSSAAGLVATPFMGAYNASKFALEGMSDALRVELAGFGIHVILIEPGPIHTHFGQVAEEESAMKPDSVYMPSYRRYRRADGTSRLFARTADDVARTIVRAVSSDRPRARYTITPAAKLARFGTMVPDFLRDWVIRRAVGL